MYFFTFDWNIVLKPCEKMALKWNNGKILFNNNNIEHCQRVQSISFELPFRVNVNRQFEKTFYEKFLKTKAAEFGLEKTQTAAANFPVINL